MNKTEVREKAHKIMKENYGDIVRVSEGDFDLSEDEKLIRFVFMFALGKYHEYLEESE